MTFTIVLIKYIKTYLKRDAFYLILVTKNVETVLLLIQKSS